MLRVPPMPASLRFASSRAVGPVVRRRAGPSGLARRLEFLAAFAAALVVSLASLGAARAQSVKKSLANPDRYVGGAKQSLRPESQKPQGINRGDCLADTTLRFSLTFTSFVGGQELQVWAGKGSDDCSDRTVRSDPQRSASCWMVHALQPGPLQSVGDFDVNVRDIVGYLNAPTPPKAYPDKRPGAEACDTQSTAASANLTLYFFIVQSGGDGTKLGEGDTYPLPVDMKGPGAPKLRSIGPGHTLLKLDWDNTSDTTDVAGFRVFCDPKPGAAGGGGDAAACSNFATAGADGGTPDLGAACANDTGATTLSTNVTGLTDGVTYSFVVAGVDFFGNVGDVSNVLCDQPEPTDDFWKVYREAGGGAGGGFCALESPGAPATTSVFGLALAAAAAAWVRRRRVRR